MAGPRLPGTRFALYRDWLIHGYPVVLPCFALAGLHASGEHYRASRAS